MHGFPAWLFWPLDLLSWCITHWGWVAAAVALAGVCIVWRRRVLVALLSVAWLAWELARPLTRPLRTWWKARR